MQFLLIGATLFLTLASAFALQKALLGAVLLAVNPRRRSE